MSAHCNEDGREVVEGNDSGNGEGEEEEGEQGVDLKDVHERGGEMGCGRKESSGVEGQKGMGKKRKAERKMYGLKLTTVGDFVGIKFCH